MSAFQLPKTLCKDLNSMMSKLWWGNKDNVSKIAWMSWERMRRAKKKSGLGYRDFGSFNLALLAKQGWRLIQYQNSLVEWIYKEKYYPSSTFFFFFFFFLHVHTREGRREIQTCNLQHFLAHLGKTPSYT